VVVLRRLERLSMLKKRRRPGDHENLSWEVPLL